MRCPLCLFHWPDDLEECPNDGSGLEFAGSDSEFSKNLDTRSDPRSWRPRPLGVGEFAGEYELLERLGQGGMATIYRARHARRPGPEVAIKVLHPEFASRREQVERFVREARAIARLAHPNIVTITDFAIGPDDHSYIVMELLKGVDLGEYILRRGALHAAECVAIAVPICRAMSAVHGQGIVHRDIKPDNVYLVGATGGSSWHGVKLLDFGIAKWLDADLGNVTRPGQTLGTPEYMSPEQVMGQEVDHRADIYSLGIIMYQMLSGVLPFSSHDTNELFQMQVSQIPSPPHVRKGLDATSPLDQVILACLAKKPEDRIASMAALEARLAALGL